VSVGGFRLGPLSTADLINIVRKPCPYDYMKGHFDFSSESSPLGKLVDSEKIPRREKRREKM